MRKIDKLNEIARRRTLKAIINDIHEVVSNYKNDSDVIDLEILFRGLRGDYSRPILGNERKKIFMEKYWPKIKFLYGEFNGLIEIMDTEVEN